MEGKGNRIKKAVILTHKHDFPMLNTQKSNLLPDKDERKMP